MTGLELAGRRMWIGIPEPELDAATRSLLEEIRPGGIALFGRNIVTREQVARLVTDLRALLGEDLRVAVDQEGGLVVRFATELVVYPGNMALGAASVREPSMGEHLGEEQGFESACEIRALGIDVNLAPVLDLAVRRENPGVGVRSFGASAELAGRLGSALVRGTLRGGVIPCLKHFPGLGAATVDPHLGLPVVPEGGSSEQLEPFQTALAAGAPLIMTSHAICGRIDAEHPTTFSEATLKGLLREEWGYDGAIMTDDLEMGAMVTRFGWEEVVRRAAGAGHEVLVVCHTPDRQRQAWKILRQGLERGESWFGDPEDLERRLTELAPPETAETGRPEAGREVATAIAGRAVTIIRDDENLLPIQERQSLLLAYPAVRAETGVEDPLRGEDPSHLATLLGRPVELYPLDHAPSADAIRALLQHAGDYDRLLLCTTAALFEDPQADLVRACVAGHAGTILVPLRNPFDFGVVAEGVPLTAITGFGFRAAHLEALAEVLTGRARAYGRMPA